MTLLSKQPNELADHSRDVGFELVERDLGFLRGSPGQTLLLKSVSNPLFDTAVTVQDRVHGAEYSVGPALGRSWQPPDK